MKLTFRDVVATAATALAAVYGIGFLLGAEVPLAPGTRAVSAVVLGLGMVGCTMGGAAQETGRSRVGTALMVLGAAVFVVAIVAIASGSEVMLATLIGGTIAMWAVATLRHAAFEVHPPRTLHPAGR